MQSVVETHNQGGVKSTAPPAYYIQRVKTKLANDEYQTEHVKCFCGSDDYIPIAHKDRYGFDHPMSLCKSCGLIYATARMNEESYRKFYENEYRQIYDWGSLDKEADFKVGISKATNLKDMLSDLEIYPKVIFDIGCNSGAWLKPFADSGCEVMGVDYGLERIQYGKSLGLNIAVGSIDTLEATGKKADLIILNHVLEHSLNLAETLFRIRMLLSDDGVLFVSVPSLYTWNLNTLFQNAHTYQFTSQTLSYIMQCIGFEEIYLDERINSLWTKSVPINPKLSDEPKRILNFLHGGKKLVPEIKTINKFPLSERRSNIKKSLKQGLPDMGELINSITGDVVIIGGGPSVSKEIDKIKHLQSAGTKVISIERMYSWCLTNGIIPDYVIALDACDDVIESFNNLHPDVIHLIATQCQGDILDRLKWHKTYIFNTPQKGIDLASMWDEHNYEKVTQINAGGSVVLCSISIALTLGARNLHVFGFDCHITNGSYAPGITGVGAQADYLDVEIEGRIFTTTPGYISFMQQFFKLIEFARKSNMLDSVKLYGDSMATWASKDNIKGGQYEEKE